MKNITISIIIVFFFNSCLDKFADHWDSFQLLNESNHILNCYAIYVLPDTLLAFNKPNLIEIIPGGIGYLDGSDFNDPGFKRLKTEKLTIFVLNKNTVDNYAWSEVRSKYMILKRYEVNEKDIINMGGAVKYP